MQLGLSAARLIDALASCKNCTRDETWQLLRPVICLCLWLLPAHVPLPDGFVSLPQPAQQDQPVAGKHMHVMAGMPCPKELFTRHLVVDVATVSMSHNSHSQCLVKQPC
jgi:hypothetical protein